MFHLQWGFPLIIIRRLYRVQNNVPSLWLRGIRGVYTAPHPETNQLHEKLAQNDSVVVEINYSYKQIFGVASQAIQKQHRYPTPQYKEIIFWFTLEL